MYKRLIAAVLMLLLLCGCSAETHHAVSAPIAATTRPVYEFTAAITEGTDLQVAQLVTEAVSCLHDYSLRVEQMKTLEQAQVVVTSGLGLEDFLEDVLTEKNCIDASAGISALCSGDHGGQLDHDHGQNDPHIWLDPMRAAQMNRTITAALCAQFPDEKERFAANSDALYAQLAALQRYGEAELSALSCRSLVTFHDGFSYFADAFGLEVAAAMELESGSEPSARELEAIIALVRERGIPAVFVEANGNTAAAQLVAAETGAEIYTLDMAMGERSYFEAMTHNIDTVKEALG